MIRANRDKVVVKHPKSLNQLERERKLQKSSLVAPTEDERRRDGMQEILWHGVVTDSAVEGIEKGQEVFYKPTDSHNFEIENESYAVIHRVGVVAIVENVV